MRRPAFLSAVLLPALAMTQLAACTVVGPDYTPPQTSVPAAYDAPIPALFGETAGEGPWWATFEDPVLNELVRDGLATNLDLAVAESRVREARALARATDARTGPSVDLSGEAGVEWRRTDEDDGFEGSILGGLAGAWEIDLFGRLTRTREAAWAEVERQEALQREARRIAAAEIARNYVGLRASERRLALTRLSLELQRRTLGLVGERVESGLAPGLDQVRARAAVSSLEADLGPLKAEADRFRNALAVLLAEPPGALDDRLATGDAEIPQTLTGPPLGVPMDTVRRRPDIQAAELQIVAATAEVGIAVADLYPRLTLPGLLQVGPTGIGTDSVVTSVLASLSSLVEYSLYDGGEREETVTAAEERVNQAVAIYRLTLLSALQEVEAALLSYQGARDRREALIETVRNNRLAYEQSQELYRQGLANFIDVLDSQRELNDSLQDLAVAEGNLSLQLVNLLAALGGDTAPGPGV